MLETKNLSKLLKGNAYPGRGIVLGNSEDGKYSVIAYFIMGRSNNSRNRIFKEINNGIKTEAYDISKVEDPSLIIYNPVLKYEDIWIVTNGDQTNTIYDYYENNKSFFDALRTRLFEPDAPNYTPRISGIINYEGNYELAIIKTNDDEGTGVTRQLFTYDKIDGIGHFLHTYSKNEDPLPSFIGEPTRIKLSGNIDEFTNELWNSLNEDNKISLYINYINHETKESQIRILNKNEGD